jgi:flagellar motor switch protein FliN/FliY
VANNDDLLTPDEIEALMQAARSDVPPSAPVPSPAVPSAPPPSGGGSSDLLSEQDIEALFQGRGNASPTSSAASSPERLLDQAESQLAAAMAPDLGRFKGPPPELGPPQDYGFEDFGRASGPGGPPAFPIAALQDVELDLRIELGRTELLIEEVLQLREGTVVPLDKLAGDPVDILVNGRLIARGEVLVLNDNFCVRVAEILTPEV